jgi:hypothetical protein
VSTGTGPVTYYKSLGGGGARGGGRGSAGASQRQLAQAQKAQEAKALASAIQEILSLHREHFPEARPPVAPEPAPVDEQAIRKRHEKAALAGISMFKRAERAQARQRGAWAADEEIRVEWEGRVQQRNVAQEQLDSGWRLLLSNDPMTVVGTLEAAFEDNEARAAALDVNGSEVVLVVLSPSPDALPERMPATTSAGNLTLKKITKSDRAYLYKAMVSGHVLATVREAFAVAPGIDAARIVAFRAGGLDAYGRPRVDLLLAARFERGAFAGVQWDRAEAPDVIRDTASEFVANVKGQAKELHPIDLTKEPELAQLIELVDADELADSTT